LGGIQRLNRKRMTVGRHCFDFLVMLVLLMILGVSDCDCSSSLGLGPEMVRTVLSPSSDLFRALCSVPNCRQQRLGEPWVSLDLFVPMYIF
jgi:hypothetical protein